MITYNPHLNELAGLLRQHPSSVEMLLHNKLKQVSPTALVRQQPVGDYILDLFAPEIMLAIEIYNPAAVTRQAQKSLPFLLKMEALGVTVLRFSEQQILQDVNRIVRKISYHISERRLSENNKFSTRASA